MADDPSLARDGLKVRSMNAAPLERIACYTPGNPAHSSPTSLTLAERERNRLIEEFLPYVGTVLLKMQRNLPSHIHADDLYSAGVTGLIAAAERYNAAQAASFAGYVCLRIRGAILDELRRMDPCTRRSRVRSRELQAAIQEIEQAVGRAPTAEELCRKLGISVAELERRRNAATPVRIVSMDSEVGSESSGNALHGIIADETQEDVRRTMENEEMKELMIRRLAALPELQRKILAMYYFEEMRFVEIASVFDLTESRICQIHREAITKLGRSMPPR
jgi:RNA polymerase sigma factor for flagellar operon FliA